MKHVDSLAYDWWKDPPDTFVHKNNFLLTKEELDKYVHIIAQMKAALDTEGANAVRLARALEGKRVMPYDTPPRPVSLASVMEFMIFIAKEKLATLNLLNDLAKRCRKQKEEEVEQAQLRG